MQAIVATFFNPILPVFAIMLVGLFFGRRGFFDNASAQAINRFVFFVAVPALLFSLLSDAAFRQVDWRLLALYFLSEIILFVVGAALARRVFHRDWGEALLIGMASCFVNHVFFVLPIAQFLYGDQAAIPITAVIVVDTTVIFAGTIIGLEIASHRDEPLWKVGRFFLRNPVLVAIALGLAVNVLKLEMPAGIRTFCTFTGSAAAPAALFSLGVILAGAGGRGWDAVAVTTTGLKVLLHPLVAWLLFQGVTGVDRIGGEATLLIAAGPCGAMPFVLALQYRIASASIGRAIVYSTIASLFTLAVLA
jgi:predicted permease